MVTKLPLKDMDIAGVRAGIITRAKKKVLRVVCTFTNIHKYEYEMINHTIRNGRAHSLLTVDK